MWLYNRLYISEPIWLTPWSLLSDYDYDYDCDYDYDYDYDSVTWTEIVIEPIWILNFF